MPSPSISDATENALMLLIFNATAWANYAQNGTTPETNIAVALHTADPGEGGNQDTSATTYVGYTRTNVARTSGGWTVTAGSVSPAAAINFPAGTGGSGTVTHFTVGKASVASGSSPPILWAGTVTPNIAVGSGVTPSLSTASTITID